MQTLHIFDAVSRDWRVSQTAENEMEVEYMTAEDSDGSGGGWKRRKKASSSTSRTDTEMVIHLFGMNAAGESVRVDVDGFRPFLYVALPNSEPDTEALQRRIRAKLRIKEDTFQYKIENKRKLYGYSGSKTYRFVKITVPSLNMFYNLRKELLGDKQEPIFRIREREKPLEVFESNIDPMLRFFHLRDVKPCGWISVNGEEIDSESGIRIQCNWTSVSPAEAPPGVVTAPLVHAFWDVECYSHSGDFPIAAPTPRNKSGDPIIQVGTTLWTPTGATERHIFVLEGCDDVPGAIVHVCKREGEMLLAWFNLMVEKKVNVFVGYNIFGFDERYVWNRLQHLNMTEFEEVQKLSHLFEEGKPMKLIEKRLASSALGDNMLYMWDTPGRLRIDLLGHIKRKAQLPSYKLDSVAAVYLSGKMSGVSRLSEGEGKWLIKTKKAEAKDARVGRYIQLLDELGEDLTDKMEIREITADGFVLLSDEDLTAISGEAVQWAVVKDDVSPAEIFKLHRGSDADRAKVAAYCVQDCDLTLELYKKLDVFNEAMSMANVCSVPVSYIFTRGQGIKIESLIFKDCMLKGQLIKVLEVPLRDPNAPSAQVAEKYKELDGPALAEAARELEKNRGADRKELEYVKKLWAFKEEIGAAKEDSYEGAIVLDPTPGFYTDSPVGVCDFASLYPSTIISENISHDMLVWAKDYDLQGNLVSVSYGSVADEQNVTTGTCWTDIEFDILRPDPADTRKHPTKLKVGVRHCRYAQPPNDEKGSLPQIVAKLLAARKAKRAEIPKTDDPFKKALLDAEQNAYKITANSLYGQLGSPTFKIRLQNLAASVTAYGRKQIMFSKAAIEKFYGPAAGDPRCKAGAEIVYGDSVTGDTPVYIKTGAGETGIKRIDELVSWEPSSIEAWHDSKDSVDISAQGICAWTERGWTTVKRIIRHKLAPGKKLFRVLTHSGLVDCTEDHSLVAADGKAVKPTDVAVGTRLLHNFDVAKEYKNPSVDTPSVKEAWAMGFFLADGSSDLYQCPSGQKASWAINKADFQLLEKAAEHLPFDTTILNTLESSGVYKLVVVGNVKEQAMRYRRLFYNSAREKRVPPCILNAPIDVVSAFVDGFYAGDGDKASVRRWDQKGKEVSAGLYILGSRLGFKASFNDRTDKQDVIRTTMTKSYQRKDLLAIKKLRELPYTADYVYDLETENHHFAVGPGALVVHNTDSIFVSFNPQNPATGERLEGREAIVATQELTEEVGKFITATLKAPHDFEYDKTFSPFIIFSKKRYVGNKYEESPDDFKETSMGIVLKRRDNAPLLKMTYGAAIDRLLNHRDVAGAVAVVQQKVRELVEGKMKLSQLTITKSLRSEYKCTPPAHKMLADRIAVRDPGNAPASGERIGYVYIQALPGQVASKLQGDRVETPEFIVANKLKPDAEYYIEHQLYNPLAQLFGLMVEKMPGFRAPAKWAENADKLVAQREAIAADLLFGDALAKFRGHVLSRSPAEFVGKMFSGSMAQKQTLLKQQVQVQPQPRASRKAPVDATMAAAEAAAFGAGASPGPKKPMFKQQNIMSAFAMSTAIFTDERLANAMRASKAAKAKAKKPKKKDEGVVEVEA
jgi:DNA polymerase elongation subunit (family B)